MTRDANLQPTRLETHKSRKQVVDEDHRVLVADRLDRLEEVDDRVDGTAAHLALGLRVREVDLEDGDGITLSFSFPLFLSLSLSLSLTFSLSLSVTLPLSISLFFSFSLDHCYHFRHPLYGKNHLKKTVKSITHQKR